LVPAQRAADDSLGDTRLTETKGASTLIRVGTPCYGGLVTTDYMTSIIKLMEYSASAGFRVHVDLLGGDSLITRSRNTLISRFLVDSDATHFMFIDADIGFTAEQVHRMLTFDKDIVAGMYPLKVLRWDAPESIRERETPQTSTLQYVGKLCDGDEFQRRGAFATGRYCGTGFMLIKRHVIDRLVEAFPNSAYSSQTASPLGQLHYALFECMIDPISREYLSEDFGFCHRWRSLGGQIWLDLEGSLAHTGPLHFTGQPALRFLAPQETTHEH
jgi:hypothetical protein